MMNVIEVQDTLKGMPMEQLIREVLMPSGQVPQFLVLSEITRRREMEKAYAQNQGQPQTTVAQDAVTGAGVPQEGIAGISRAMAPNTDMAQNTGAMPQAPVQQMASGGYVQKMNRGGIADLAMPPLAGGDFGRGARQGYLIFLDQMGLDDTPENERKYFDLVRYQRKSFAQRPPEGISAVSADVGAFLPSGGPQPSPVPLPQVMSGVAAQDMPVRPSAPPSVDEMRQARQAAREDRLMAGRPSRDQVKEEALRAADEAALAADRPIDVPSVYDAPMTTEELLAASAGLPPPASETPPVDEAPAQGFEGELGGAATSMYGDTGEAFRGMLPGVAERIFGEEALRRAGFSTSVATAGDRLRMPEGGIEALLPPPEATPSAPPAAPPAAPTPTAPPVAGGAGVGGAGGGAGIAGAMSPFESEIANLLQQREKRAEQDKWLALAQVGLSLMGSRQPTFAGALGEAGAAGLAQFQQNRAQYDKDRLELLALQESTRLNRAKLAAAGASKARLLPDEALTAFDAQIEAVTAALKDPTNPPTPDEKLRLTAQLEDLRARATALQNAFFAQYGYAMPPAAPAASGVYSTDDVRS